MQKARHDRQPTRPSRAWMIPARQTVWLLAVYGGSPEQASPSSPGSGDSRRPATRRVLVVEDDWLIAAQIESCLAAAGFDMTGVAVGPDDALQLIRAQAPDLVLMDIRLLGGADGVELATQLRQDLGLRCLFVSANVDTDTERRAASAQPLGWLAKPFTETELIEAVSEAFERLGSS